VYGCVVFIHIPKEKRIKLDVHSKKYISVRNFDETKGFCFYNLAFRMIIINGDVNFVEDHYWHS
jgi:hypothetical protein